MRRRIAVYTYAMTELLKRWFCVFTLILCLCPTGVSSAEQAKSLNDVERQIQETAAQLEALDAQIASGKEAKSELQKALKDAQSHVGERQQRLKGLNKEIKRYNNKLDKLDSLLAQAHSALQTRQLQLAQSLRDAQIIGKHTALKIVLQHDDPALSERLTVYSDYVLNAQEVAIDQQVSVLKRVEAAQAHALKERNWLNHIHNKAHKQRENFSSSAIKTQYNLGEVVAGLNKKTATVADLRANQQRLQSLMEELKALQGARSGYFAAGKGSYPAPIAGTLSARFGDIKSVGKLRWSGWFIRASRGQAVSAIADGEVIYSDWLQGFGMLVILNHGDNYSSLYGGNRDVTVPVGDWVESGATIATVGDSGGQSTSGLYFEIRHNAQAVDPEEWLQTDLAAALRP